MILCSAQCNTSPPLLSLGYVLSVFLNFRRFSDSRSYKKVLVAKKKSIWRSLNTLVSHILCTTKRLYGEEHKYCYSNPIFFEYKLIVTSACKNLNGEQFRFYILHVLTTAVILVHTYRAHGGVT